MKSRLILLAICAAFFVASCQKKDGAAADAGKAKADSIKAAYTAMSAAWDAGKADEMDKYVTAGVKDNDPMPGQKPGLAGVKEMVGMMHSWYPDMKSTIDYMGVDGDMLTVSYHMSGTNSGMMMGMPATNKKVNVHGIDIMKWDNGKFAEHWGVFDVMGMMQQLGLAPMPGAEHHEGDMGKDMKKEAGPEKKK